MLWCRRDRVPVPVAVWLRFGPVGLGGLVVWVGFCRRVVDYMLRVWCNGRVVTPGTDREITALEAAAAAGITYRQLDHWARQGWVTPSVQGASGRGGRRLYSPDDVLRLAALRHLAKSGWPVAEMGEGLASVEVASARFVVAASRGGLQSCVDVDELVAVVTGEDQFSVFDLGSLQAELTRVVDEETVATDVA